MKSNYQHIFTPLTVKNMTIKNRIVMMPMGTNYGEQNGEMSFLHINYYKERAKGGTGLIIVENASVDSPQGSNGTTQLRIDHDNYLPRLYKFCEEIHKYGTCIAIQINHAGASAVSARTNLQPGLSLQPRRISLQCDGFLPLITDAGFLRLLWTEHQMRKPAAYLYVRKQRTQPA